MGRRARPSLRELQCGILLLWLVLEIERKDEMLMEFGWHAREKGEKGREKKLLRI